MVGVVQQRRFKVMGGIAHRALLCLAVIPLLTACASADFVPSLCALHGDVNYFGMKKGGTAFGGTGIDIASFGGERSSYIIVRSGDFASINGPNSTAMVKSVDLLVFDDMVLDLHAAMSRHGAPRVAVLDRIPLWHAPKPTTDNIEGNPNLVGRFDRDALLAPCTPRR
jgi:hypothetical protein